MGYKVTDKGKTKKSFRALFEKTEFTFLGLKSNFLKSWPILLKLIPRCSIGTPTIPTKFQHSECFKIGAIDIQKFRQYVGKLGNRYCEISQLSELTDLKFCGHAWGTY